MYGIFTYIVIILNYFRGQCSKYSIHGSSGIGPAFPHTSPRFVIQPQVLKAEAKHNSLWREAGWHPGPLSGSNKQALMSQQTWLVWSNHMESFTFLSPIQSHSTLPGCAHWQASLKMYMDCWMYGSKCLYSIRGVICLPLSWSVDFSCHDWT